MTRLTSTAATAGRRFPHRQPDFSPDFSLLNTPRHHIRKQYIIRVESGKSREKRHANKILLLQVCEIFNDIFAFSSKYFEQISAEGGQRILKFLGY